jgi:acyl-CoA thioester hydrolase
MGDHGESATLLAGLSGALTAFGHRLMARVYYADTDFSGVVYHARYLEFAAWRSTFAAPPASTTS